MSIQVRRPLKLSFRVRRNFATRDWTTIGLRGVRVSLRKAVTRTTTTLAGSNASYTQAEESRIVGFHAPASNPPRTASAPSDKDWSELLWLGLVVFSIAAAATVQVMQ
jgi:hypothetical protein